MLQYIRDHATGWVAWGIVLLICIPFALWGVNEYVNPNATVSVAEVDGEEIGYYHFQREYARRRQQLQSLLGAAYTPENIDESRVRRDVLDRMIDSQIVAQLAGREGMLIGDEQLAASIQGQDIFRLDGRFDQRLYDSWLQRQGYSPGGFEAELRQSIAQGNLEFGIARSGLISDRELAWFSRVRDQRRTFSVLTVPAANFQDIAVSDDQARAFFESERSRFYTPEAVKLQFVKLSRTALAESVNPDEAELRAVYEAQKLNFVTPELREASHILIAVDSTAPDAEWQAAVSKIESIASELRNGAEFGALAKQHSQDPGSAQAGGSLGKFGKGVMDPAFENAAFELDDGEVSGPVRSAFGVHLIKVDSVEKARTRTFGEARAELLAQHRNRVGDQIYAEQVELLANLAFEHPESLDVAASELELALEETSYIPRAGLPGDALGSDPKVLNAAFSAEVLGGNNAELVEIAGSQAVVFRVLDHRQRAQQSFEEAKPAVLEALKVRMIRRRTEEEGLEILAALRGLGSIEEVAEQRGLEWVRHENTRRSDTALPAPVRSTAFSIPRPASAGTAAFDGVSEENGDFIVVALHAVEDGDVDSLAESERESVRSTIESDLGQMEYDAFLRGRRTVVDVKVHEGNLEEG